MVHDTLSWTNPPQKRVGGVAPVVGPKFKPQYWKQNKTKQKNCCVLCVLFFFYFCLSSSPCFSETWCLEVPPKSSVPSQLYGCLDVRHQWLHHVLMFLIRRLSSSDLVERFRSIVLSFLKSVICGIFVYLK
jgi:hypothetical protein